MKVEKNFLFSHGYSLFHYEKTVLLRQTALQLFNPLLKSRQRIESGCSFSDDEEYGCCFFV